MNKIIKSKFIMKKMCNMCSQVKRTYKFIKIHKQSNRQKNNKSNKLNQKLPSHQSMHLSLLFKKVHINNLNRLIKVSQDVEKIRGVLKRLKKFRKKKDRSSPWYKSQPNSVLKFVSKLIKWQICIYLKTKILIQSLNNLHNNMVSATQKSKN